MAMWQIRCIFSFENFMMHFFESFDTDLTISAIEGPDGRRVSARRARGEAEDDGRGTRLTDKRRHV